MHKLITFLILVTALTLAGCAAGVYSSDSTYDLGVAQARATADAGRYMQTADTARREAQAISAQQTAQQVDFERQITSTAVAQVVEQTHAAATQSANASATAWMITQTPMAATQQAVMLAASKAADQAKWQKVTEPIKEIVPVVLLVILAGMVMLALALIWPRLMRLMNVLERRASTTVGKDGQMIVMVPADDNVNFVSPYKMFDPALQIGPSGGYSSGGAPLPQLQDAQNSRTDTIALTHAASSLGERGKRIVQNAMPQPAETPALQPVNTGRPNVEVVDAESVKGWLDEVEGKLLTDGGGED